MPRKKHVAAENESSAVNTDTGADAGHTSEEQSLKADAPSTAGEAGADAQAEGQGKNWGPPYKAIFTSTAKGFEMGEDRRFKQRVFKFKEKPAPEILERLKDAGFVYRGEEKAWTIHADNASRLLSDELAAEFAGESRDLSR